MYGFILVCFCEFTFLNSSHFSETRQKKIISLEEDKKLLMIEIRKLQQQYLELNGQIDNMTSLINNKQVFILVKYFLFIECQST